MKRVLMKIAYLGSGFSGSQTQPGKRTVESQVLSDLRKVLGTEDPCLEFSSRTDRGVNALGNTIAFVSPMDDLRILSKALNSVTDGVFYRQYCGIDGEFNVRHASRRIYRYILDADGIDFDKAKECCGLFEGTHDFVRFCRYDGKPTTLTIDRLQCYLENNTIVLQFEARYYLWNMIRRIASAVESVGRGKTDVSEVEAALNGKNATFGVGRPESLTLMDVQYDMLSFEDSDPRGISGRKKEGLREADLLRSFYSSLRTPLYSLHHDHPMDNLEQTANKAAEALAEMESSREEAIRRSRSVIRLSKNVMHAIHTGAQPDGSLGDMRTEIQSMLEICEDPAILMSGPVQDAMAEFAEAEIMHALASGSPVQDYSGLRITPSAWILGLCDCEGEMRRMVVSELMEGHLDEARVAFGKMESLHEIIMGFDISDGVAQVRRKQDIARGVMDRTRSDMLNATLKYTP